MKFKLTTFRPTILLIRLIIAIRKAITYVFTRNASGAVLAGKFCVEITSCNIKNQKAVLIQSYSI